MIKIEDLKDKKVLILGLGKEGQVTLNYLKKHFPDKKIAIADKNQKSDLPDTVSERFFGPDYLNHLTDYEIVIKSPGIKYFPEIQKAKEAGVIISSATALFFANCPATKIIGITGTKGKSTTTSLIYEVLKAGNINAKLVGNIGFPALAELDDITSDTVVVYELSSYQLEDLEISPDIAVFINIYPEHLDYHESFKNYLEAKSRITAFQSENDYFIYNSSFNELKDVAQSSSAKKLPFSLTKTPEAICYFDGQSILYQEQKIIEKDYIPLKGDFNLQNIMPAVIIGKLFDLENNSIVKAIKEFQSLPHRLEFVVEKAEIKFYNDSLATIPQATAGALEALGEDVETLIAGGFDRGIDYSLLGPVLAKSKVKNLILFPTTGEKIWQAAISSGLTDIQKFEVSNMEEAVKVAFDVTSPGKICLLSPASTSYNMFKDYADRGDKFKKSILEF